MGYPRIIEKVYREPWLIKSSVHQSIQSTLSAALNGERIAMPYDDEDGEEQELYNVDGVSVIPINGLDNTSYHTEKLEG